jgi:pilus assembly protein CpaC
VPGLSTRRVDTEIELQNGQSFAIGGLLNNQTTETLARIPGLADIPILGKLFTSKSISKQNSELLVIVTPELVEPIPQGESLPELPMPQSFIEGPGVLTQVPRTPGPDKTGPLTPRAVRTEMSVQEMEQIQRMEQQTQQAPVGTAPANTLPTVGVPGVNMPAVPAAPAGGAPDASGR